MSKSSYYNLPDEEKGFVIQEVRKQIGIPDFAVEKDWWVVQTLRTIFSMDVGGHLLFKGGTSLSKAWGLIDRFSEDVDLSLNREFLGFHSGFMSKTQVRKLRSKSFQYITQTFTKELEAAFVDQGITDLRFEFENLGDGDQDPVSILIYYPFVTAHSQYLEPRVKVEIGSRSLTDPYSLRSVRSLIGHTFDSRSFADENINIPCVNPERTYLEKLFLLHEEFQKPKGKVRVDRLSRHLYDIEKIYQSEYVFKALDLELITDIIEHRRVFNGMKGIDYDTHYPPNLSALPPQQYLTSWSADYAKMRRDMIHGDSLSFDQLLDTVSQAISEYNNQEKEKNGQ